MLGFHHECCGPVHLPVSGRHWREAGQEDKQQLASGRALRPRLRRRLHRWSPDQCMREELVVFFSTSMHVVFHFVCLFAFFYLQSLLPWEHVSRVELDYTPTGYSSAVSSECSCSSAPTGRPMCPGPSTLACKSFQSILAAAGGCINDQASAPLPRPTHFHHVTSLCRVDVTEVQIAITIMYLMSAFGGVSLWQAAVMDCYIFNTAKYGHTQAQTNAVTSIQTATLSCTRSV